MENKVDLLKRTAKSKILSSITEEEKAEAKRLSKEKADKYFNDKVSPVFVESSDYNVHIWHKDKIIIINKSCSIVSVELKDYKVYTFSKVEKIPSMDVLVDSNLRTYEIKDEFHARGGNTMPVNKAEELLDSIIDQERLKLYKYHSTFSKISKPEYITSIVDAHDRFHSSSSHAYKIVSLTVEDKTFDIFCEEPGEVLEEINKALL